MLDRREASDSCVNDHSRYWVEVRYISSSAMFAGGLELLVGFTLAADEVSAQVHRCFEPRQG